jgi:hypothetical protein
MISVEGWMLEDGGGNAKTWDSYDSLALAQNDRVISVGSWRLEDGVGNAKTWDSYDSLALAQNDRTNVMLSERSESKHLIS